MKNKKKYEENMNELIEKGIDPDFVCDYLDDEGNIIK